MRKIFIISLLLSLKSLSFDYIKNASKKGKTPLIAAAQEGKTNTVEKLLLDGANPNIRYYKKNLTALHIASMGGFTAIVQLLLRNSAGIEMRAKGGFTPLMFASRFNHEDIVKMLLNYGADINAINDYGYTALDIAQVYEEQRIIDILEHWIAFPPAEEA